MVSPQSFAETDSTQSLRDGSIAAALVFVLLGVFVVDFFKKEEPSAPPVVVEPPPVVEPPIEYVPLKMAVTEREFDDMGSLLTSLGPGYKYKTEDLDLLLDIERLKKYDTLFLTCGGVRENWVEKEVGNTDRGQRSVLVKPEVWNRATDNLRRFVTEGGTLYASDQRYSLVRDAFREIADTAPVQQGNVQHVEADVVDAGLRELVGQQIHLPFDQPSWYPAGFKQELVTVMMRGPYNTMDNRQATAPLLVRFKVGSGVVIFTSFHNEKVNGEVAVKLLKYLVFATVLAKTEEKTNEIVSKGGFVAKGKSLLSASSSAPSETKIYKVTKPSVLRFVLGFEAQGAKLKLTVVSPSGKKEEKEGTSTFQIDIPEASVGDWKYTITALKMPYDNFPFTLTIGSK